MQPKNHIKFYGKLPIIVGVCFLLTSIVIELISILFINSGHLIYTLDDPYIHLALAEHIKSWHYGINNNEFSAPSSSILWPFILAPLMGFSHNEYIPLIINIVTAIGTIFFFWKILIISIYTNNINLGKKVITLLLVLLILWTNTIGLIFTGMEHSLQLFFVIIIVYYLILETEINKVNIWLIVSILIAPLVRYENIAVSFAAIIYLFIRKYYMVSAFLFGILILLIGGFSIFLLHLNLGPLPTSVFVKSLVISNQGNVESIFMNLYESLTNRNGFMLYFNILCLISFILFSKQNVLKKLLAGVISLSIFFHLMVGKYGWYNRYEVYIWSVAILTLLHMSREIISNLSVGNQANLNFIKLLIISGLSLVIVEDYIEGLITIPLASNNIYEQHYQMHRFAVEYYDKPVAVNDIGYVSFRNHNYVLDLGGLASITAMINNKNNSNCEWMNELAIANNVQLIMIYEKWFKCIPSNWIKIGELHLGKKLITPWGTSVAFFALNNNAYKVILEKIQKFEQTLPKGVEFVY